jgi:hypothetical protein
MYLLDFMKNKTKSFVLKFVIYTIIFVIIIDELFSLTKFVSNYNDHFDFGRMMRKTCDTNYTEYETERFQVAENMIQIRMENDKLNSKYHIMIFILSIILAFYINFILTYMFLESMFNNIVESIVNSVSAVNPAASGNFIVAGVLAIANVFKKDINEYLENSTLGKQVAMIITIMKFVLFIYLALNVPISIIVKLATDVDISPFGNQKAYVIAIHSIVLFLVLVFPLIFGSKIFVSYVSYVIFFALYIVIYEYAMILIDIYMHQRNPHIYENSDNKYLKNLTFSHYYYDSGINQKNILLQFFTNLFGMNTSDGNNTDIQTDFLNSFKLDFKTNIITKTILETFGFQIDENIKNTQKIDYNPVVIDNYNVMLLLFAFSVIMLFIVYIVLCFICYTKGNGNTIFNMFHENTLDKTFFYYFGLVPMLILFIVILIILVTKEYNTIVNKYIVYKPHSLYKRHINRIYGIFNQILQNDRATVSNDSVCKNIANVIHLVIYTNLFRAYDKRKLFVPELTYVSSCSQNTYIDYNKLKEYDFNYYARSIFHYESNCINIDNQLLSAIMKSAIPVFTQSTITDADYDVLKANFMQDLKYSIYNIINKKTYDGKRNLEYSTEYALNNSISLLSRQEIPNIDNSILMYVVLMNDMSDEYVRYMKSISSYTLRVLQSLIDCNTSDDFVKGGYNSIIENIDNFMMHESNGAKSADIKKAYLAKYQDITSVFIKTINTKLTSQLMISDKNNKLSKFIIENYNYFNRYDHKHTHDSLYVTDSKTKVMMETMKYVDMTDIESTITKLDTKVKELAELFKIDTNYDPDEDKTSDETDNMDDEEKSDDYSDNIESIISKTLDINEDIVQFQQQKQTYIDLFKQKNKNSKLFHNELQYEYKINYIDGMIKIYKNVVYDVKTNYNFFKSYDIKLEVTDFEDAEFSLSKKENNVVKFDYFVYKRKYAHVKRTYENKYDALFKLVNDIWKIEMNSFKYKDMEKEQDDAKKLLELAQGSSSAVYALCIIYIICIVLAYYIQ